MPVNECALGIVFPRPDVQRVEGWQSEAIGRREVVEDLSHKKGRGAGMLLIPRTGDHEVVGSGQFDTPVRLRLVEYDLGTIDVHDPFTHQCVIYVVETHCPKIVSAHATEFKMITVVLGCPNILKPLGGSPNTSEKGALLVLVAFVFRGRRV